MGRIIIIILECGWIIWSRRSNEDELFGHFTDDALILRVYKNARGWWVMILMMRMLILKYVQCLLAQFNFLMKLKYLSDLPPLSSQLRWRDDDPKKINEWEIFQWRCLAMGYKLYKQPKFFFFSIFIFTETFLGKVRCDVGGFGHGIINT